MTGGGPAANAGPLAGWVKTEAAGGRLRFFFSAAFLLPAFLLQ
ncbi:hypothetical protein F01_490024 [Burkholderia cenocepacia]|nr:hypothetical protein F01_490024 [Burkholderia cenocepacia]